MDAGYLDAEDFDSDFLVVELAFVFVELESDLLESDELESEELSLFEDESDESDDLDEPESEELEPAPVLDEELDFAEPERASFR